MVLAEKTRTGALNEGRVVAKAVVNAAERLGLSAQTLAQVVGLSSASVSRMKSGSLSLQPGTKPFELSLLLIRLFRSLDAITGGDGDVTTRWMRGENTALGGRPADMIKTISGLMNVLAYLDARRALV